MTGKVYLIGAGPGAQDLMTLRGANILAKADIVFYDALVDSQMLVLCPQAKLVAVGKRCGKFSTAQKFIEKQLLDAAKKYQTVVRLKGGDPMIFGRADEEMMALKREGIDFEVVPGITSALAAAASIQSSLTLRGVSRSVAFVTNAQAADTSKPQTIPNADTLIYYMGRKESQTIAKQLLAAGKSADTPVVIVESISTNHERRLLTDLAGLLNGVLMNWGDSQAPAILMIGDAFKKNYASNKSLSHLFPSELNDTLQDGFTLSNRRRSA
jgi:uroporphyrin-III C-methyltransferase